MNMIWRQCIQFTLSSLNGSLRLLSGTMTTSWVKTSALILSGAALTWNCSPALSQLPTALTHNIGAKSARSNMSTAALGSIYDVEGERRAPTSCSALKAGSETRLLTRYIASLHGAKAVVREHCFEADTIVDPHIEIGSCAASRCATYDTYRRGPTYFARFLAAMSASISSSAIELWNMNRMIEGQEMLAESRDLLLNTLKHERVLRQRFKFNLGGETRCVAQIKIFKDRVAREREQRVGDYASVATTIDLSPSLSSGFLWADHRQTPEGYELLIIEHRFAEGRGVGEVFERDLLCVNPRRPVSVGARFEFTAREIDRDTLRIYARSIEPTPPSAP